MTKLLVVILNCFLVIQLVSGQAKTAWSANAGMGLGGPAPVDPTEHQINMAIVGINNAKTEGAAAKAAAAIYSPALDMSDNVKQALENKVRQLRTPPGWPHPIPPPLPFGFDVMHIIMNAYYGTPTVAPPVAAANPLPAVAAQNPIGPPTTIRRGPAPGKRQNRQQQNAWQPQNNNMNADSLWNAGIQSTQQPASADWTPPAGSTDLPMSFFDLFNSNSNQMLWG